MAEKVSPIRLREEMLKLRDGIKDVLKNLRAFVETEDYSFVEKAQHLCESLDGKELPSFEDLRDNVNTIYSTYRQAGGKLDTETHAHLVSQAVYTIVRANILSTGLEFKVKRMRGF
ncbi:MAG: hypothetical protein QXO01_00210 [Nitrososphaerota archaeon]